MGTSLLEIELRGGLVSAGAYDRRRCASVDCGPAVVMWCASPALRRGRSLRFWVTDLELEIRVIFSAPHGARSTLTCLTAGAIRECPTIVYVAVCQLNMPGDRPISSLGGRFLQICHQGVHSRPSDATTDL